MSAIARLLRRSPAAGLIGDLVKWTRDPRTMRGLMADSRATWDEAAFMRALPPSAPGAPQALILSMSDWPYEIKVECMLATELRRRGWSVRILTSSVYSGARRIFAAHGITDLLFFEKLVWDPAIYDKCETEAARLAAGPMDFASVKEWTYGDAWIGPQLLASVSRKTFNGAPDPRDPAARGGTAPAVAARHRLRARRRAVFRCETPRPHSRQRAELPRLGPFVDVAIARGIPIVHFIQPSREDALVFKCLTRETRRIHPHSISLEHDEPVGRRAVDAHRENALDEEFRRRYSGVWHIQARNQPGTVDMTAQEIRDDLDLDPAKPTAVLFSHVLWDANLFYGERPLRQLRPLVRRDGAAAAANPRSTGSSSCTRQICGSASSRVSRPSTARCALIRERVGELPPHVRVLPPETKISTLSLFRSIDAGITVRGSIGYELPCFGVPVVTAGTGRYSGLRLHARPRQRRETTSRRSRGFKTVPRLHRRRRASRQGACLRAVGAPAVDLRSFRARRSAPT